MPVSLADLEPDALASCLEAWGFNGRHAGRILRAHYRTGAADSSAHRLPERLGDRLREAFPSPGLPVVRRQVATDGTVKLLLGLKDGRTVESVLMPDFRADRAAGCLSSQVGCAMGCDFCATARSGFDRDLAAGEIVEQFLALRREAAGAGRELKTVVFMGMGEPLLNLPAVLAAIGRIAGNHLGGLGWRQVTVSTVGIVPGMDALTESGLNVQLAVSLHAPDDVTRARLLPMGRRYRIEAILAAADRFQAARRHPVVIQYCLLRDVNDGIHHAESLGNLLRGRRMHLNLLPYHPTGPGLQGVPYRSSTAEAMALFAATVRRQGIVTHVRRSRGCDIDAACGQLRRQTAGPAEVAAPK
ncbi:MAG: 23S rRNA (adenine(2503)-C(2))-methyltransferase RlmN [Verrucomicrobia bacterium]|nr:23S rRNA (adenine(2503)-C(2))-methyltransferase RlmN [Verrucomicrobiota bacterium]